MACENPANRGEFRVFNQMTESLFEITKRYAHRVRLEALRPAVNWRQPTA